MSHCGQRSASTANVLWRVIRQQKADMDVGQSGLTGGHCLKGTPPPFDRDTNVAASSMHDVRRPASCLWAEFRRTSFGQAARRSSGKAILREDFI
jgi:hypothetical protein